MQEMDLEKWPRKEIYRFFSGTDYPFYSVTFNLDVTELVEVTRKKGLPFYPSLTYLVTKAIRQVDAFSYCVDQGILYKLDPRWPSYTELDPETELFYIVTIPLEESMKKFCEAAKKASREQKDFITEEGNRKNLVYISCIPWLEITSVTNEHSFDKNDAFPRITWGKYYEREKRKILGISVEVNHCFIDGVHIGKFGQILQKSVNELNS